MAKILLDEAPKAASGNGVSCPFFMGCMYSGGLCLLNGVDDGSRFTQNVSFGGCAAMDGGHFDFDDCPYCTTIKND